MRLAPTSQRDPGQVCSSGLPDGAALNPVGRDSVGPGFVFRRGGLAAPRPTGTGWQETGRRGRAFTLLEVVIAMAIFFMAIFAILSLVSQNLQIARSLSLGEIDISTVAVELTLQTLTNREMSEGFVSGDFGETFPGATWNANLLLVSSNAGGLATRSSGGGLYQADIMITWPQNHLIKERQTSLLLYRPNLGSRAGGR